MPSAAHVASSAPKGCTADPAAAPETPALTAAFRAWTLLGIGGASLGFLCGTLLLEESLPDFFLSNSIPSASRNVILAPMVLLPALFLLVSGVYLGVVLVRGGGLALSRASQRLYRAACLVSPLFLLGVTPLLFNWRVWERLPLEFTLMTCAFSLGAYGTIRMAGAALPSSQGESAWIRYPRRLGEWLRSGKCWGRLRWPSLPALVVAAATLAYIAYFSYYTVAFHVSVRTGYDTSIYDNLLWNIVHGGPFFKASSRFGPQGGHFGVHAELFAYALAPFYAIYPRAHTLMVAQSTLIGAAAWPLYCLARRRIGEWGGATLAVIYLLHPAVHGANLFEFHFLPLGIVFLWAALNFLEARRDGLAALAIALTLSVREDVSFWVVALGLSLLLTGTRPRAGLIVATAGALYFVLMKFVIMPRFSGAESFTFIYRKLVPRGEEGLGAVIKTLLTNPAFTLIQIAEPRKLLYSLQLLAPLFFLPLRRPAFLVLAAPMLLFSYLSTEYDAVVNIRFQYGAHALAFLFIGAVWALERMHDVPRMPRRTAALMGMLCAAIPVSYQFGAVLQQNTAFEGPIRYTFGIDAEGAKRRDAIAKLLARVPPRAKITASAFTTPQVTHRPDAYNMTLFVADAEYFLVPSERREYIANELETVERLLGDGSFGIVAIEPPFALARKGHSTKQNRKFLRRLGR